MDDDLTETVHLHARTTHALLVSTTGDETNATWIPESQVLDAEVEHPGDEGSLTVPTWLAKDRGWV